MRRAARRDEPETEIVKALRKAGCLVLFNAHPDLIVQRDKAIYLLEVKRRNGKLTQSQEKLKHDGWIFHVVHNIDEAFEAVGLKETSDV